MKKLKVKISPKAIELAKAIVAAVTQPGAESRDMQIALMIAGKAITEYGRAALSVDEGGIEKATHEAAMDILYPEDANPIKYIIDDTGTP